MNVGVLQIRCNIITTINMTSVTLTHLVCNKYEPCIFHAGDTFGSCLLGALQIIVADEIFQKERPMGVMTTSSTEIHERPNP